MFALVASFGVDSKFFQTVCRRLTAAERNSFFKQLALSIGIERLFIRCINFESISIPSLNWTVSRSVELLALRKVDSISLIQSVATASSFISHETKFLSFSNSHMQNLINVFQVSSLFN